MLIDAEVRRRSLPRDNNKGGDYTCAIRGEGGEVKKLIAVLAVLGMAPMAWAQNADDYRGGWRTDSGDPHIYQFSIRGDQVRGVYCTRCSDATTLAFIDGTLGAGGLTFTVTHVKADGSTEYQDRATARFDRGTLVISGSSGAPRGSSFNRVVIKDSRGPDPLPVPVSILPAGNGPVPALGGGARGGGQAPGGGAVPAGGPHQSLEEAASLSRESQARPGGALAARPQAEAEVNEATFRPQRGNS